MGDENIHEEDPNALSEEEQAIIDGAEPDSGTGESGDEGASEDEGSTSETEKGSDGDDKGPVPYDRFSQVYQDGKDSAARVKELEEQLNINKEEAQSSENLTDSGNSMGAMVVSGGVHDGKTWNEVYQDDPATALEIRDTYLNGIQAEKDAAQKTYDDNLTAVEAEMTTFIGYRAETLFQKNSEDLTQEEADTIQRGIQEDVAWADQTGRGHGKISDIHFLRNREEDLQKATSSGAAGVVRSLQNGSVASISSGEGKGSISGYDADIGMSRSELSAKIEAMSDTEFTAWKTGAPGEMKTKFSEFF